jgi:hypothetical protein
MQAQERFWSRVGKSAGSIALTVALAVSSIAARADTFTFTATDSGSGTFSYGILGATNNGDGSFNANSGYLLVITGPIVGEYPLFPNPSPPTPFLSPSGAFSVDDQLFPSQDPVLDVFGLLFTGSGLEVNIWGTAPGTYSYFAFDGSSFPLASTSAVFTLAGAPAPQIELLQTIVTGLVNAGVMLPANGNSLQAKLNAALNSVNRGNDHAAVGQLHAFINQVNAFIHNGTLSAVVGQSLIDQANAIIAELGG